MLVSGAWVGALSYQPLFLLIIRILLFFELVWVRSLLDHHLLHTLKSLRDIRQEKKNSIYVNNKLFAGLPCLLYYFTISGAIATMLIDNKKLNLLETQTTNTEKELQEVDGEDEISYDTEDLLAPPTPSTIYNWRIVIIAITASFAAVIVGYDAGFIGGTVSLASFQGEFKMNELSPSQKTEISSNVVSVFQAGLFGALFLPHWGNLGKKIRFNIICVLVSFGAGISLEAKHSTGLASIYAGRVITGLGVGGCSGMAPIYISECSPAKIRGKLVGMWEMSWQIGGIVGYWINYGVLQNLPQAGNNG